MSFLQPLGWLGLLAVPIIIIIYVIKSKYVPKTVSSTFIWKRSMKYMKRRIPINFVMSLVLILQLLVAIAATLAITQPQVKPGSSGEKIVIVDASASMKISDGTKTRYEVAVEKLTEASDEVGENTRMTIIMAGAQAACVSGEEPLADKARVLDVISEHVAGKCSNSDADILGALDIAATFLEKNAGAQIQLYTDKQYVSTDGVEVIDCIEGRTEFNTGIISVTDKDLAAGYRYNAVLYNQGIESSFTISLRVDGAHVESKKVTMMPGETKEIVFTPMNNAQPETGKNQEIVWISRSIKEYNNAEVYIQTNDGLNEDNSFVLYSGSQTSPKILYVSTNVKYGSNGAVDTSSTPLMRTVLGSNGYVIKTNDMYGSAKLAPSTGYDLYIYEGVLPAAMPTDGAVWFLNIPEGPDGTRIIASEDVRNAEKEGNNNGFTFREHNDASSETESAVKAIITNNVDFSETIEITVPGQNGGSPITTKFRGTVNQYRPINNYPSIFEPIYLCNSTPVMLAGTVGTVKTIVTAFDFTDSSLPIYVSDFPVLIQNMIEYSIPDALPNRTATIGEKLVFNAPAGTSSITYYYKSNEKDAEFEQINEWFSTEEEMPEIILDRVGTYQMKVTYNIEEEGQEAQESLFTMTTHIPTSESKIIDIGNMIDVPEIPDNAQVKTFAVSILPYIIFVLIVLLIIEWGVYYRDEY
ncbi:MAG: BatA and WFA domain-containing protein [Clostridia bacterium]|nr:BatA and WFA domain-containing protein [Clostridia bacterium]MBQ7789405.1 BatA and WFA domain-containing protein [Clostridia bacterium]